MPRGFLAGETPEQRSQRMKELRMKWTKKKPTIPARVVIPEATMSSTIKKGTRNIKKLAVRDLFMAEKRFYYAVMELKKKVVPSIELLKNKTFQVGKHIYNYKDMSSAEKKAVKILAGMRIGEAALLSLLAIGGVAGAVAFAHRKKRTGRK